MTSTQHTAGPWVYDNNNTGAVYSDNGMIASVYGDDPACRPDDAMRANARLIAAAPDLLAALSVFAGPLEHGEHMTAVPNDSEVTIRCQLGDVRRAVAAISKVIGAAPVREAECMWCAAGWPTVTEQGEVIHVSPETIVRFYCRRVAKYGKHLSDKPEVIEGCTCPICSLHLARAKAAATT